MSPYAFNVIALWAGQTVINLPQTTGGYFNVRYALVTLPAVAAFAGYACAVAARRVPVGLLAAAAGAVLLAQVALWLPEWPRSAPVIADGMETRNNATYRSVREAGAFLRRTYDGTGVLMDDAQQPRITAPARLPMRSYVASFSGDLYKETLADPAAHVGWIAVRTDSRDDRVFRVLAQTSRLEAGFTTAFDNGVVRIYRRAAPAAPAPSRP